MTRHGLSKEDGRFHETAKCFIMNLMFNLLVKSILMRQGNTKMEWAQKATYRAYNTAAQHADKVSHM